MADQLFTGFVQEPDVCDGVVITAEYQRNIVRTIFHRRKVNVLLFTHDQRVFFIAFRKVQSANINNPKGMRLCSLKQMSGTPPFRRFIFVNHDLASDRELEVVAQEISSIELTEEYLTRAGMDAIARHAEQLSQTTR